MCSRYAVTRVLVTEHAQLAMFAVVIQGGVAALQTAHSVSRIYVLFGIGCRKRDLMTQLIHLLVYLSVRLSICPSICVSVCICVYLTV